MSLDKALKRKLTVKSNTLGTHHSTVTTKRGKGHIKLNAMPHWSSEDFKEARKQRNQD
jgi:hypothetical protein